MNLATGWTTLPRHVSSETSSVKQCVLTFPFLIAMTVGMEETCKDVLALPATPHVTWPRTTYLIMSSEILLLVNVDGKQIYSGAADEIWLGRCFAQ